MTTQQAATSTTTIIIDPELANLCPVLKEHERVQLEANLQNDGCREPLVLWGDTLLDGHNRYKICSRLKIKFGTVQAAHVASKDEAIEWVIKNQLGRRNITPQERDYLLGKRYAADKSKSKSVDGAKGGRGRGRKAGDNLSPALSSTAAIIASEVGVNPRTVMRAEPFAKAIDVLVSNCGENVGREIRDGKVKLSKEKVIEISKLPKTKQASAYREAKLASQKSKRPIKVKTPNEGNGTKKPKYDMPTGKKRMIGEAGRPDMIDEIARLWSLWDQRYVELYCIKLQADGSEESIRRKKHCHDVIGAFISRLNMLAHICAGHDDPKVTAALEKIEQLQA